MEWRHMLILIENNSYESSYTLYKASCEVKVQKEQNFTISQ